MSINNIKYSTKLYNIYGIFILFLMSMSLTLFSCKSLNLENTNKSRVIKENLDDDDDDIVQNNDDDDNNNNDNDTNNDDDGECFDPSGGVDANICEIEHYIIEELNEFRSKNSLPALKNNKALSCAARDHSKDQASRHMIGHWGFNTSSREKQLRDCASDNASVSYLTAENVAMTYTSSSSKELAHEFMVMWEKSWGHRVNMLNSNSTYIGVGVVKSGSSYYATQVFGR